MAYANNKGADQPAHPASLISTFVVHCLYSMRCILAISKVLASFCSRAGWFESYLVENPRRHVFAWCGSNDFTNERRQEIVFISFPKDSLVSNWLSLCLLDWLLKLMMPVVRRTGDHLRDDYVPRKGPLRMLLWYANSEAFADLYV